MDINEIENEIIKEKDSYNMFIRIIEDDNINDITKTIYIRLFLKHDIKMFIDNNLLIYKKNLKNYQLTLNTIKNIYNCISRLLAIRKKLNDWEVMYRNLYFKKLDINKQYEHVINLKNRFLSLFDGSKGTLYIFVKLEELKSPSQDIIVDLVERLEKLYKLFKHKFFEINDIKLLTLHEFIDCKFFVKLKYIEKIFKKISNILNKTIDDYEKYNLYTNEINNIMNPHNIIDIEQDIVNSDFDEDDINLISNK